MAKQRKRHGGIKSDPAVEQFKKEAAVNMSALSKKERAELQRVRLRYDVPKWLKDAVETAARNEETSFSQMGAFLLAWALRLYQQGDEALLNALQNGKKASPSLRLTWNLSISREIQRSIVNGAA